MVQGKQSDEGHVNGKLIKPKSQETIKNKLTGTEWN